MEVLAVGGLFTLLGSLAWYFLTAAKSTADRVDSRADAELARIERQHEAAMSAMTADRDFWRNRYLALDARTPPDVRRDHDDRPSGIDTDTIP